jgi:hypothetical protein
VTLWLQNVCLDSIPQFNPIQFDWIQMYSYFDTVAAFVKAWFHGRFFSAKCEIFRLFLFNCEELWLHLLCWKPQLHWSWSHGSALSIVCIEYDQFNILYILLTSTTLKASVYIQQFASKHKPQTFSRVCLRLKRGVYRWKRKCFTAHATCYSEKHRIDIGVKRLIQLFFMFWCAFVYFSMFPSSRYCKSDQTCLYSYFLWLSRIITVNAPFQT